MLGKVVTGGSGNSVGKVGGLDVMKESTREVICLDGLT
jgi:hypothetical protein